MSIRGYQGRPLTRRRLPHTNGRTAVLSPVSSPPVDTLLELLKRNEDENCRRLETGPCRYPSFKHEHWPFGSDGRPDCLKGRRRPRSGGVHYSRLLRSQLPISILSLHVP